MRLFLDFCLIKNDVIAQIVSYIEKELFAKRPTIVAVFVLTLAPWARQTITRSISVLKRKLNKGNLISMPQVCALLSFDNILNLCWAIVKVSLTK
jgi:hypothetical protein